MIWTIVPAKDPAIAKGRLAEVLMPDTRRALAEAMTMRTLAIALGWGRGPVLLVSASSRLRAMARRIGARTLTDGPKTGLNAALTHAVTQMPASGRLLVLPTDLPTLDLADLDAVAGTDADCVLAPDGRDEGTNALLCPPLPGFFQFGPGSFAAHRRGAEALGLSVAMVRLPGLAFDLDLPADLAMLHHHPADWLAPLIRGETQCQTTAPLERHRL